MKVFLKSALVSALLAVSSANYASDQTVVTALSSGVSQQHFNKKIAPQQDFYQHVNGHWLDNEEIPADMPNWGAFTILRENSTQQLHDIVEELAKSKAAVGSNEHKVGSLYASYMDTDTLNRKGLEPLAPELNKIAGIKNQKDFTLVLAEFAKQHVTTPFDFGVIPDLKKSDQHALFFGQSGLGLPDRDYYLKDDEKLKKAREAYEQHIVKVLTLAGESQADAAKQAASILALETAIAKIQWDNVQNRDYEKMYNIYTLKQLQQLTPAFDWKTYFKATSLDKKAKTFIVTQESYFKDLNTILSSTPLSVWQSYLKFHVINGSSPYLSQAFADANFDMYSKTLRGVMEQRARWKRGVDLTNTVLGESLGQVYVAKYFQPEKKQRMEKLVDNLMLAFEQNLSQLDWMGAETKAQAHHKLKNFRVKIGYPNQWRDYSKLEIKEGDLIGNLRRANDFMYDIQLGKLANPVDREEWHMTPQTVNAYYNPMGNEIVFPAAILQPPFFDMDADDAVNYGAIGAVIGHEISHGFDDQGSRFDADGNMKNWWTEEDEKKFKEKTKALVEQYNSYEALPGYFVNGELTLGENIADNSGLAVAYKAYQLSLDGKPAPVIDGYTGDQRFYMGWTQAWRAKVRPELTLQLLKTDPHSPAPIRGRATLLNQDPFYEAFGVKKGDKMYLEADKRVKIW
ncbi:M13 family metallopeptidase [Acinetobacter pecorum]|uniref:M13 family metallopeptidase n=1 Tax=Acinetobacter pecorum TaxID=2762215 RepID=A0ABR8VYY5_9GAMM|nr:M13 family metallopeptidase [Acinetobacter pecorum]MBD8009954.1 M13 family metallopeptidase [Acinetobacter pecorum]